MKRIVVLTIGLMFVGLLAAGCEDTTSTSTADVGIQEGRRPVNETPRKPPGPPEAGLVADDTSSPSDDEPESDEPDEP